MPISYLADRTAMVISVFVECCHELCLAPCTQDPNNFFMIESLVFDSFLKNISF